MPSFNVAAPNDSTKSVDRFSQASSKQADVMIRLTKRISWLTVAILVLTVVLAVVEVVGCLGAQP